MGIGVISRALQRILEDVNGKSHYGGAASERFVPHWKLEKKKKKKKKKATISRPGPFS